MAGDVVLAARCSAQLQALPALPNQPNKGESTATPPKRGYLAVIGSLAVTFASTLALCVNAAPPANAADGSLEFCPYLPYLAANNSQISQDEYSWTLYQVDDAGHNLVRQHGRNRGCHVVSPVGNAAYRVEVQGDCYYPQRFQLKGMSPAVWVPEAPTQVRTNVEANWSDC